jgi:ribonuclease BN (tRNA processing enzyme)
MRVRLLPSAPGKKEGAQFLSTFLVNDEVAIDAGSLGLYGHPRDQARIRHVFLTHSHADHLATLPIFVENAYEGRAESVIVYGHPAVLASVREDIFNDRVWPDFVRLSRPESPYLRLQALADEVPVEVAGLRLTPVPVEHVVPTYGFIVENGSTAVVFGGDSGPTTRLWELARANPRLTAAFVECTFPDSMHELADVSAHMTPATFAREVKKLPASVQIVAIHIKPRYRSEVLAELTRLALSNLTIGKSGTEYSFGEQGRHTDFVRLQT